MFNIWSPIIVFAFAYNMFYIPISIGLEYEASGLWYALDVAVILIYIFDIVIELNSARLSTDHEMIVIIPEIRKQYVNGGMLTDIIAAIPFEYFAMAAPQPIQAWVKIHRMLKLVRIIKLFNLVYVHGKASFPLFNLTLYFFMFIYLTHFAACFYFYIGRL
jgi:hypothetical protein